MTIEQPTAMPAESSPRKPPTEVAEQLRRQARELMALADEIDGAPAALSAPHPEILGAAHVTVQTLAEKLRTTEKTARKIGNNAGARFEVGGRVYFDLAKIESQAARGKNYRELPCSSLPKAGAVDDDLCE